MDTVDAVVQAIRNYLSNQRAEGMYYDDAVGLSTEVRIDGLLDVDALARAAIDALGLTEETATIPVVVGRVEHTQPCELPDQMIAGEEMHTCGFRSGHFEFHPSSRLVSGWVRKDNTNE